MTIDELFALREEMAAILSAKLMARKTEIEKRLRQLNPSLGAGVRSVAGLNQVPLRIVFAKAA